jgi:hypothetical protein
MKSIFRVAAGVFAGTCVATLCAAPSFAQAQAPNPGTVQKGAMVTTMHARGPFDVKLTPQPTSDATEGSPLGRMSIDKQYHGDLDATAKGEMLSAMTAVRGSGVYVALEKVSGTLGGKTGTFLLHHTGVMARGTPPQLSITVVTDSGTGQLEGLAGTMKIDIAPDGKHSYDFEYTIAKTP